LTLLREIDLRGIARGAEILDRVKLPTPEAFQEAVGPLIAGSLIARQREHERCRGILALVFQRPPVCIRFRQEHSRKSLKALRAMDLTLSPDVDARICYAIDILGGNWRRGLSC